MFYKKLILIIFLLFSQTIFSQGKIKNSFFTIRGNIGIPKVISSSQFRKSFTALYEGNVSVNLRVFDNFYTGLGYQNTLFKNNDFFKQIYFNTSIPYNTRLNSNGVFLKLGYDNFFSKTKYASYSLNSGLSFLNYYNVNQDSSIANKPYGLTKFSAPYLQPEVSINFIVDKTLSFSLMISYTTLFYRFDPKAPRFNQIEEIKKRSNVYVMTWINIGFGFTVLLNKK
jgi:hypothetical protein